MDGFHSAAFEDLVSRHQPAVWRYLRFLGAAADQAEDLLQETFFAVWRRPFEQRGEAATRAYLTTVARNLFLTALRRGRVQLHFASVDEADLAWKLHAEDGGAAFVTALRECLERLPGRQAEAVRLQYYDARPRDEVGRLLGISVEGVKTLLRRVRAELRACVREKVG